MLSFATPPPRDVYTTTSGGSWVNALNWDLGVSPATNQTNGTDDIIITHHITLTGDLDVKSGTNITVEGCDTLHVTGDVTFNNGSSIVVEPCAVLIVDGNVTNNNNSTNVNINGTLIVSGNYTGGNGSELGGSGSMDIDGTVTTDGDATVFGSEDDCIENCDSSAENPLPIELAFFKGEIVDNTIRLIWLSLSEINNDYFRILKYDYNGNNWEEIGVIDGAGNTSTPITYSFIDSIPKVGSNIYKLVQVDFDGNYETFKAINVQYNRLALNRDILIYPNPTEKGNNFNVELLGFNGEKVLVVVVDVLGKIYYEKVIVTYTNDIIVVSTKKLNKGTYLVIGTTKQELYKKVIIVD